MCEHDLRHAGEIVVQKRRQDLRVERLHKRGKAGDIGEERRDFTALSAKIEPFSIRGQSLGKIRGEVAGEGRMRSFGRQLPAPRLAEDADVANGLSYGRFEIGEIDRLGNKVESAAVHG